jgi:hypothetical protein
MNIDKGQSTTIQNESLTTTEYTDNEIYTTQMMMMMMMMMMIIIIIIIIKSVF